MRKLNFIEILQVWGNIKNHWCLLLDNLQTLYPHLLAVIHPLLYLNLLIWFEFYFKILLIFDWSIILNYLITIFIDVRLLCVWLLGYFFPQGRRKVVQGIKVGGGEMSPVF